MKPIFYTFFLLLLPIHSLFAQSSFASKIVVGTSATLIYEGPPLFSNEQIPSFTEWTWHKNIAVNVSKHIHVGINLQNIYTKGSHFNFSDEKNNYFIAGIFGQYRFLPNEKLDLFAELSWNLGNYCNCEFDRDPYELDRVQYIGIGGGMDYALTKQLHLDIAFTPYFILKKDTVQSRPYFYHPQYIVGLNYEFQL